MYGSTHVEARQMSKGNFRRSLLLPQLFFFSRLRMYYGVSMDGIHFDYYSEN